MFFEIETNFKQRIFTLVSVNILFRENITSYKKDG